MIGLLGGTFDPIHYGHLRPAQEVMRAIGLAELRVIPAGQPPHRAPPLASAEQRLEMTRLACAEFGGFVVDDRELKRAGPSYTVDTLIQLRAEIGDRPLCLLIGTDAFRALETWHEWDRLPDLAHLVVMRRPETEQPDALPQWARLRLAQSPAELVNRAAGKLWFQSVTPQYISGTRLRAAIARHEPVGDWLPAPVWEYIRRHHIYLNSNS